MTFPCPGTRGCVRWTSTITHVSRLTPARDSGGSASAATKVTGPRQVPREHRTTRGTSHPKKNGKFIPLGAMTQDVNFFKVPHFQMVDFVGNIRALYHVSFCKPVTSIAIPAGMFATYTKCTTSTTTRRDGENEWNRTTEETTNFQNKARTNRTSSVLRSTRNKKKSVIGPVRQYVKPQRTARRKAQNFCHSPQRAKFMVNPAAENF